MPPPPPAPPRARAPQLPSPTLSPTRARRLWTCRAGFEPHLFEELAWAGAHPRLLGEALVEADPKRAFEPVFGRMGFDVEAVPSQPSAAGIASTLARMARGRPLHVQVWTVDTATANPLSAAAEALREEIHAALAAQPRVALLDSAWRAREQGGLLGQLCVSGPGQWVLGAVEARDAVSLSPGGRQRMRRGEDAPSRAAAKLEEALDSLGVAPSRGDTCVDLGAAPGGWTRVALARGAKVTAVDPARLSPELLAQKKVQHIQESAFTYAPDEPVDWLLCDMAWRPLEVAQLLAKWARRQWALHLVANIKLPMKDKNPVLHRVRHLLADGGWQHVKVRQLYHDRDEVTVTARRLG